MGETFRHGHALIIGVGADLPATVDDAVGLADILRDAGRCAYPSGHVDLLTGEGATVDGLRSAFKKLIDSTDHESTVIVYFSGHGFQVVSAPQKVHYLLPYGYDLDRLEQTAINGAEFAGFLRAIPAQKLLVLLDCCHAGGVGEATVPGAQMVKSPLPPEAQSLLAAGRGKVLVASSRQDEVSYTGKPYSAFSLALVEALCGTGTARDDGYVRVADLAMYAREVVPRRTDDRQHPILDFAQADNFVLAYYAGGETKPKGLPFVFSRVEPLQLVGEEPAPFPSEHLSRRMEPIRRAIERVLASCELDTAYFHHVDRVIGYLGHLVKLLPAESRLSEREAFTLLAATYLHRIGLHFPHPERSLTLERFQKTSAVSTSQLVQDRYHELSWEWVRNSTTDGTYPHLGLATDDPVPEIALVCLGHQDADLGNERYAASGAGSQRIRPALLAALLGIAGDLAVASSKPTIGDLQRGEKSPETLVLEWMRYYLDRISIQGGHIRFHYLLPAEDYSLPVRVLLSGPMQRRLRQVRDVLGEHGVVIVLDSSVSSGPVHEMPPEVLDHARKMANQLLASITDALGQPESALRIRYHFTGLRKESVLKWQGVAGAEYYLFQLFDQQQNLVAQRQTSVPETSLPETDAETAGPYEWIAHAHRGGRRLGDEERGIFWLVGERAAHWIDRQMAWYASSVLPERHLARGQMLANYGLYEEAISIYQTVLDRGTGIERLQARRALVDLYTEISQRLNQMGKFSAADWYLDAALNLAADLRSEINQAQPGA